MTSVYCGPNSLVGFSCFFGKQINKNFSSLKLRLQNVNVHDPTVIPKDSIILNVTLLHPMSDGD